MSGALLNREINADEYRGLLSSTLPHVIRTEEENESYIAELETLHSKGGLTPEEREISALLTLLIEDFESKHYQISPCATPIQVVRELMDARGLRQSDMVDVFGTASVVSEVLSGKRELSKSHIENLSRRFHVSPEVFFPVTSR